MKLLEIFYNIKKIREEIDKVVEEEEKKMDNMTLEELKEYSKQIKKIISEKMF